MSAILLGGYTNQNSSRNYPFVDHATLRDSGGNALPTDYIVDAALYPLDVVGPIYLSELNIADNRGYITDADSGDVCGYFALDDLDVAAAVYEPEYDRQVGVIVFGDGRSTAASGGAQRTFTTDATQFAPAAAIPLNQFGVRGFLLPDGEIKSGDVVFEGQDGIKVKSTNLSGSDGLGNPVQIPILEFDIIGVPKKRPEDCDEDLDPYIEELIFIRENGSIFLLTEFSDNIVAVTTDGINQDQICEAQKTRALSPAYDYKRPEPCDDDPPAVAPPPNTDTQVVVVQGPAIQIVPAQMPGGNPVAIAPGPVTPPFTPRVRIAAASDIEDIQSQVDDVMDTPHEGESIVVGFKGLGAYND